MTRMRPRIFLAIVLLAGGMLLSGCEDEVNPFVEEDRFYTLFGFLDTGSAMQFVRVIELRQDFSASGDTFIDAAVTTLEVESGQTQVWQDSLISFSDGSLGHIFHASFRPIPGWTYQLTVTRSDGIQTRATTTIPLATNVELEEPIISGAIAFQKVRWQNIDFKPFRVEIWYRFMNSSPRLPFLNAVIPYGSAGDQFGQSVGDDVWEVLVRLTDDKEDVTRELGISADAEPILMAVGMRLTVTDKAWRPPDGVFDKEILVQPGTFSNVEQGFGFFGSLNQYTTEWTVDPLITSLMGYTIPGKR